MSRPIEQDAEAVLHEFDLSSASYRVRIALNLKGVPYRSVSYRLRAGEQRSAGYLVINPAGLVPTLEIDGLQLSQSLAIIEYLDSRFPNPPLLSQDPARRAATQAICQTIACDIHPLNNLRVLKYLEERCELAASAVSAWYAHWISAGFETLESMLSGIAGPFADGEHPNLAEICIVPQLFNARRFEVDLSPYPTLVKIGDRAAAHPAFLAAAPVG